MTFFLGQNVSYIRFSSVYSMIQVLNPKIHQIHRHYRTVHNGKERSKACRSNKWKRAKRDQLQNEGGKLARSMADQTDCTTKNCKTLSPPRPALMWSTLGSRLPFFIEGRRWNEPKQTARQAERLSEVDSVSSYLYDKRATNFLPWSEHDSWLKQLYWDRWSLDSTDLLRIEFNYKYDLRKVSYGVEFWWLAKI